MKDATCHAPERETPSHGNGLESVGLHVSLEDNRVLINFNLSVQRGGTLALLGPSGCGKTTFLRTAAGLLRPAEGRILWDGADMASVPPHRRNFGLVFQDHALLPHRNVGENVGFGLRMRKMAVAQRRKRVEEMLKLVGLRSYERRSISTLSGGEAQRVALARSLAPQPLLLLLDEPLATLDRPLSERLIADLRHILATLGQTAVHVTHDHAEAFALARRVALMRGGSVHRVGTPEELVNDPRDDYVANFLSLGTTWSPEEPKLTSEGMLETPWGNVALTPANSAALTRGGREALLLITPEAVMLESGEVAATISAIRVSAGRCRVTLEVANAPPICGYADITPLATRRCYVRLNASKLMIIKRLESKGN